MEFGVDEETADFAVPFVSLAHHNGPYDAVIQQDLVIGGPPHVADLGPGGIVA